MVSRRTRLTLLIDQSLANNIRRLGTHLPEGILIIDEAHERSIPTDLLLGLIKEALPHSPKTRIVITSATLDVEKFASFFEPASVIRVSGRCFPVVTQLVELEKYEHVSGGAARGACNVLKNFAQGKLEIPAAEGEGKQIVSRGTVIVLLPGKEDISNVMSEIRRQAEQLKVSERVQVLSCHGESDPEEQDRVQTHIPEGTLRFVCGTEVLRSSVTLPEVVGVVDSLEVKRFVSDARGVGHLTKIKVSKAESDQGKGRAGRTQPGFYMPVAYKDDFAGLDPHPTPAILQQPISNVVLQVASIGRSARTFSFIDRPPADKIDAAIKRLQRLGALDEQEAITPEGELLVKFPIDPERAKVLVMADKLGVLPEAVIVTAILEAEGIAFRPKRDEQFCLVDEILLRQILSQLCHKKTEYSDRWEKVEKPSDPAAVDFSDLPAGITRQNGFWRVTFRYEPTKEEIGECKGYEVYDRTRAIRLKKEFQVSDSGLRWISDLTHRYFAGDSRSDFAATVRCYRAFKAEDQRLKRGDLDTQDELEDILAILVDREDRPAQNQIRRSRESQLRDWCQRWFVNYKRLRMAEQVMREIRDELYSTPLYLEGKLGEGREFNPEDLTKALAAGLIDNVARYDSSRGSDYAGGLGEFQLGRQSACPQGLSLILVGGVRKIPAGRRGALINLADMAAPIKPEWLTEVMPQLCSKKRLADYRYDSERDLVVETQEAYFVDLKVGDTAIEAADKQSAATTFCAWLAREMANERRY
jgi:HrpA-like RNA helicase